MKILAKNSNMPEPVTEIIMGKYKIIKDNIIYISQTMKEKKKEKKQSQNSWKKYRKQKNQKYALGD